MKTCRFGGIYCIGIFVAANVHSSIVCTCILQSSMYIHVCDFSIGVYPH